MCKYWNWKERAENKVSATTRARLEHAEIKRVVIIAVKLVYNIFSSYIQRLTGQGQIQDGEGSSYAYSINILLAADSITFTTDWRL